MRPTLAPSLANTTARLLATVDLPTPPFPDETKMMFLMLSNDDELLGWVTLEVTLMITSAVGETKCLMAFVQAFFSISFIGHAGVVSSNVKLTWLSVICKSLIMFKVTRSFLRSGSSTFLSASKTCCGLICMVLI